MRRRHLRAKLPFSIGVGYLFSKARPMRRALSVSERPSDVLRSIQVHAVERGAWGPLANDSALP
jgi:hypothetical protein